MVRRWLERWLYPRLLLFALAAVIGLGLVIGASTSGAAFGTYTHSWEGTSELRSEADAAGVEMIVATDTARYEEAPADGTVGIILASETPVLSRGTLGCISVVGFGVLAVNAIQPVFPGMSSTPPLLLALVAPLIVLAILTIWGLPVLVRSNQGLLVLALLVAPLAFIGLGLTAGLAPQYDMLVRRTQTFVHFGTVVITVTAAFVLHDRVQGRSRALITAVKIGLPIALVLVAVITMPIAFIGLEALSYQGTTTEAEFSTATFASTTVDQPWTSDDHVTRVEGNYYGSEHNAGPSPVYNWLHGGDPPACVTVAEDSWTTVGAQLYPAPPQQLDERTYANWQADNNLVYVSGQGDDRSVIAVPPGGPAESC